MFALQIFQKHHIRTYIDADGTIWWAAKDVGDILGIVIAHNTLHAWPEDEKTIQLLGTISGSHQVLMVNEPGLYRLIFQSRKPAAETFKRWVFRDVLPALRQTGTDQIRSPALPAPAPRRREHAEVSMHLLAVWRVLRQAADPVSNREIAHRAGVGRSTARAHTKYLFDLGLLEVYELFPRHLYAIAEQADKRNAASWQRLETLTAVMEQRHTLDETRFV